MAAKPILTIADGVWRQWHRWRGHHAGWPSRPIVHACHHKAMTALFERCLGAVTRRFGVPFHGCVDDWSDLAEGAVHLAPEGRIHLHESIDCRGSHMIRDPRDVLVSSYRYHLRCNEAWCTRPAPPNMGLPAGVSYQQHLRSLSFEDGLVFEMAHVTARTIQLMADWTWGDERFLELRFEDVVGRERWLFEALFSWYGLPEGVRRQAVEVALSRVDRLGKHRTHARPVGVWRDAFTARVKECFKQHHQTALEQLGYVTDSGW